jgi:ketosteroid isomerase-like protein
MRKMKSLRLFFLLVIAGMITVLVSNCKETGNNYNTENEKLLIEKTINNSIGWAKTKDLDLLYSIVAQDTNFLEVHPEGNVVRGFNDFKKAEAFWMSPDFKAVRYQIRDLNINISESGSVAWWFCILDDINEWKGQPASWENTRWTGVLEKRNGKWQIVQQHFSFASE